MTDRLVDRLPLPDRQRLLADLRPPPAFASATFDSYLPDPAQLSQAAALSRLRGFAAAAARSPRAARATRAGAVGRGAGGAGTAGTSVARGGPWRRLLSMATGPVTGSAPGSGPAGVYLDGGFGVGKTHLLAATWHATPGAAKFYGTFVEYTNLAGALGFRGAVDALAGADLVCIDEFELDDPGDTVLMARLLRELSDSGTRLAATSNTLPGSLGAERFAAEDFLREIQSVAERFEVLTVDGEDYRHRGLPQPPPPVGEAELVELAERPGAVVDDFGALLGHLARLHPSRYGALLDGVRAVGWRGVGPLADQNVALRLVVLVDRLYDRDVPVLASGGSLGDVFTPEMLRGGYRKKYLRALSRVAALARLGADLADEEPAA